MSAEIRAFRLENRIDPESSDSQDCDGFDYRRDAMTLSHPASVDTGEETSGAAVVMRPPRLAMALPVAFAGDHDAGGGTTANLSCSGCAVTATAAVPVGTYLQLLLKLEQWPVALAPVGLTVVRWSSHGRFGVECIKIDPVDQERLRWLVTGTGSALQAAGNVSRSKLPVSRFQRLFPDNMKPETRNQEPFS